MISIILIPLLIAFFITLFSTHSWIKKAKKIGLTGKDIHKLDKKDCAEAGGINVLIGALIGIFVYIYIQTFQFQNQSNIIDIFAIIISLVFAGMIGFIDDIFGWKIGMTKKARLLLLVFASIPLMVINAGQSSMMGIEFGLLYPLLIIPLGIIGATATFNFLAGYNGLETSQGIIILSALAFVTYQTGNSWLSVIALTLVASLCAFYVFNKNPAHVFPGDVLTYSTGVMIPLIAILGNIEKIALFFFIPYIIEVVLKLRGKLKKESFSNIQEDGTLKLKYRKIYGLEHLAVYLLNKTKYKATETRVVWLINAFQIIIILVGILLFLS